MHLERVGNLSKIVLFSYKMSGLCVLRLLVFLLLHVLLLLVVFKSYEPILA